MSFMATPEFHERYQRVSDKSACCIDSAVLRILREPEGAWARQSRVRGELGWAWLVVVECGTDEWSIYWDWPGRKGPIRLLLLLPG